jgi:PspAB-like protein
MGFMDALRGKRKLRQPTEDRLFAMSTAVVPLQESGLEPTGRAAMVFQPLGTTDFDAIVKEMEEVLQLTGDESGTTISSSDDTFGYRWMVLADQEFEDLVVGLNAVNSALRDGGYGDRVLAAVFPFRDARGQAVNFIYNVKRAAYYPFVPQAGSAQARDSERELQLKARFERDLPLEQDLGRWFPLWGAPI